MAVTIGGERVARLTDLRRSAKTMIEELKAAKSPQESRVVLTTHGRPVAVLQEYNAYQALLNLLAETQQQLYIAKTRDRLRQMNKGTMRSVSLQKVITQRTSASTDPDPSNV